MKYRKKPVVVEAFQMTMDSCFQPSAWPCWLVDAWEKYEDECGSLCLPAAGRLRFYIRTIEGNMYVDWNDWIIRGVKGELYPCKPDIFEATYEPVE